MLDLKLPRELNSALKGYPSWVTPKSQSANYHDDAVAEYLPCPLVFTVASLDLFVLAIYNFFFQNLCSSPLVDARHFQNLGGI